MNFPSTLALAVLLAVSPLAAETQPATEPDQPANIHFTLTMLDSDAAGSTFEQTVRTLLVSDRTTRTHAGWRVPFPVVSMPATDGKDMPVTSYQYQDVGLALTLQGRTVAPDRVRASGQVEISGIDRHAVALNASAASPQIGTFSHHFEASLLDGQSTELVTVPKPDGGTVKLTLVASIQR